MVVFSDDAESQLGILVSKYTGFRTKKEYGITAFQYWYYQLMNYTHSLDAVCEQECDYGEYEMPYWGNIVYSCKFVDDECMIFVHEFKFNMRNFYAWLRHKELKEGQQPKNWIQLALEFQRRLDKVI